MGLFTRPQRRVIRHFGENTTMHGVGHIAGSRRFARVLWALLLLVSITLLMFQIYQLAVKFLSRPVTTKLVLSYETPTNFPTVTLCNLNPLKYKKLKLLKAQLRNTKRRKGSTKKRNEPKKNKRVKRQELPFTDATPIFTESPPVEVSPLSISEEVVTEEYEYNLGDYYDDSNSTSEGAAMNQAKDILVGIFEDSHVDGANYTTPEATASPVDETQIEFQREHKVMYAMNTINTTLRDQLTFKMKDILLDCSFLNRACTEKDFVPITSARYGKCFQFNGGMNSSRDKVPLRKVFTSGAGSSLTMTLFVDQDNYLWDISAVAGYKIIIHDASRPPIPEEEGILLMPGQITDLGAKLTKVTRETEPYGRCKEFSEKENEQMNLYLDQLPFTKPNVPVCMRTCEQILVIRHCKCYSMELGFANARAFDEVREGLSFVPACSIGLGGKDTTCVTNIRQSVANGQLGCKTEFCKYQSCKHDAYEVSQSHAFWPATNSFKEFENQLNKHSNKNFQSSWTNITDPKKRRLYVSENFLKINVYLSDLTTIQMKTEASYGFMDLLSDFGGNSGLWLGLSVFTFFELCVFIFDLLTSMYKTKEEEEEEEEVEEEEKKEEKEEENDGEPDEITVKA